MKSATIPSVRVAPELREQVEGLLRPDETLSQFVESAVRDSVRQRARQAEFIARGLHSLAQARQSGDYIDADAVIAHLEGKLASARRRGTATR